MRAFLKEYGITIAISAITTVLTRILLAVLTALR